MTLFALTLLTVGVGISGWQIATQRGLGSVALPSLRIVPLPIVGLGLQLVALRWPGGMERLALLALSQVLLLTFFAVNFKYAPLRLLFVGFALNLLPMLLNGGYMPITPEAMVSLYPGTSPQQWSSGLVRAGSKDIVLPAEVAPLWFLGDVFVISKPFIFPTAFSIGDLIIVVGFGWAVYQFTSNRGVSHAVS